MLNFKNVVVEWEDETKMYLNVNHALLNNNIQKNNSKFSKPWCDTYW